MYTQTQLKQAISEGNRTGDYYNYRVIVGVPAHLALAVIRLEWHDREVNGRTVKRCYQLASIHAYSAEKVADIPASSLRVSFRSCRYCKYSAKWVCLETGERIKV
jgi:hypothetical protein